MWREVAAFAAVFAVSAALPGPDTMLLFSRALSSGTRAAMSIAVGLTLGKLALLTAAVLGVTAAAAALGPLFVLLKAAGGSYLIWLAVRLWRRTGRTASPAAAHTAARSRLARVGSGWRGVGLGAVLTVGNPQALLFYLAVLPAVLGTHPVGAGEYLLLCAALAAVMAAVAATYVTLATRIRATLTASKHRIADRIVALLLGLTGAAVIAR